MRNLGRGLILINKGWPGGVTASLPASENVLTRSRSDSPHY